MKLNLLHLATLSAAAFSLTSLASNANAQASIYGFPTDASSQKYALLNGDFLSLYVNDRGDIGAPRRANGTKPVGFANGLTPYIAPDGRPDFSQPANSLNKVGSYGALFSETSTAGLSTLQDRVQAKQEYITVGKPVSSNVLEGFSVVAGNLNGGLWQNSTSLNLNGFSVNGSTVTGPVAGTSPTGLMVATSILNTGSLQITQQITMQDGFPSNAAKFSVRLKNTSTTETLTNVQYARAVDPNQGYPNGSTNTFQRFGTGVNPNAFALRSVDSPGVLDPRSLAIGVVPGDGTVGGTTLYARSLAGGITETALLTNPTGFLGPRVLLDPTGSGATYTDALGNVATTANFVTDPFRDSGNNIVAPTFLNGDEALVLLSPVFASIRPQEEQDFDFYYFFGNAPFDVPEPGTYALLLSGLVCGGGLAMRRRRR